MGGIALPALGLRPPEDPTEGIKTAIALKGLLAQQQMQGQQMQLNQLNIQKQQQQEHDRQALIELYQKHQGNTDKIVADAPSYNISPETIQTLQLHSQAEKKNAMELVKAQGEKAGRDADLISGAADILDKTPEADRPATYTRLRNQLSAQGVDVNSGDFPQEYPGPDGFKLLHVAAKAHSALITEASKQAGIAKDTAQAGEATARAGEATAQTKKLNMEMDLANPINAEFQKAKYQKILQNIHQNGLMTVPPDDLEWAKAYENAQAKTTTQSDSLGISSVNTARPSGISAAGGRSGASAGPAMPGVPGGGPTGGGTPAQSPKSAKESIVDLIGQYRTDPALLSRTFLKHPEILSAVQQKYPDFDQTTYAAKNAFIKGLTSGHDSKALDAINTAMGHLKNLDDAVDALNNGNMTLLNKIGRIYNVNIAGKTAEAAFRLIANRVGTEVTSAYVPGGGGEKERIANEADFSPDLPPQTLHNNAAVTANMLRSKISSMENRYKQTMQRDDFDKYITPEAKAALAKFGAATQSGGGSQPGEKPVYHNGKLVGYTTDGKTMRPAQ